MILIDFLNIYIYIWKYIYMEMSVPKRNPKESQKVPRQPRGAQKQSQCSHATAVACEMMPRYAHATQPMAAALVLLPPQKCKNALKWTQNEIYGELLFRKNVEMKKCVWTAPARTDCI